MWQPTGLRLAAFYHHRRQPSAGPVVEAAAEVLLTKPRTNAATNAPPRATIAASSTEGPRTGGDRRRQQWEAERQRHGSPSLGGSLGGGGGGISGRLRPPTGASSTVPHAAEEATTTPTDGAAAEDIDALLGDLPSPHRSSKRSSPSSSSSLSSELSLGRVWASYQQSPIRWWKNVASTYRFDDLWQAVVRPPVPTHGAAPHSPHTATAAATPVSAAIDIVLPHRVGGTTSTTTTSPDRPVHLQTQRLSEGATTTTTEEEEELRFATRVYLSPCCRSFDGSPVADAVGRQEAELYDGRIRAALDATWLPESLLPTTAAATETTTSPTPSTTPSVTTTWIRTEVAVSIQRSAIDTAAATSAAAAGGGGEAQRRRGHRREKHTDKFEGDNGGGEGGEHVLHRAGASPYLLSRHRTLSVIAEAAASVRTSAQEFATRLAAALGGSSGTISVVDNNNLVDGGDGAAGGGGGVRMLTTTAATSTSFPETATAGGRGGLQQWVKKTLRLSSTTSGQGSWFRTTMYAGSGFGCWWHERHEYGEISQYVLPASMVHKDPTQARYDTRGSSYTADAMGRGGVLSNGVGLVPKAYIGADRHGASLPSVDATLSPGTEPTVDTRVSGAASPSGVVTYSPTGSILQQIEQQALVAGPKEPQLAASEAQLGRIHRRRGVMPGRYDSKVGTTSVHSPAPSYGLAVMRMMGANYRFSNAATAAANGESTAPQSSSSMPAEIPPLTVRSPLYFVNPRYRRWLVLVPTIKSVASLVAAGASTGGGRGAAGASPALDLAATDGGAVPAGKERRVGGGGVSGEAVLSRLATSLGHAATVESAYRDPMPPAANPVAGATSSSTAAATTAASPPALTAAALLRLQLEEDHQTLFAMTAAAVRMSTTSACWAQLLLHTGGILLEADAVRNHRTGETIVIVGPPNSGKTTLALWCVAMSPDLSLVSTQSTLIAATTGHGGGDDPTLQRRLQAFGLPVHPQVKFGAAVAATIAAAAVHPPAPAGAAQDIDPRAWGGLKALKDALAESGDLLPPTASSPSHRSQRRGRIRQAAETPSLLQEAAAAGVNGGSGTLSSLWDLEHRCTVDLSTLDRARKAEWKAMGLQRLRHMKQQQQQQQLQHNEQTKGASNATTLTPAAASNTFQGPSGQQGEGDAQEEEHNTKGKERKMGKKKWLCKALLRRRGKQAVGRKGRRTRGHRNADAQRRTPSESTAAFVPRPSPASGGVQRGNHRQAHRHGRRNIKLVGDE